MKAYYSLMSVLNGMVGLFNVALYSDTGHSGFAWFAAVNVIFMLFAARLASDA